MEDIEHILTCSICMDLFEIPRQLPCQHTFCEKCLTDYINSNTKNKPKSKPCFSCPLCRAETELSKQKQPSYGSEFQTNLTIKSLLDSKEILKAIEKKKLPSPNEESTSSKMFSKIKKKLFTRTKSTQTDLDNVKTNRQTKPKLTPEHQGENKSTKMEMENYFCSQYFCFQYVPNLYQIVLQRLIGPLISLEPCTQLRKAVVLVISVFSAILYLFLGLSAFQFEWESLFLSITIMSFVTQLCFVRLKLDITMIRNRGFALAGFIVTYVFTVYIFGILFLVFAVVTRDFVLYQKYGFSIEERAVFTPEGLINIPVRQFNTKLNINSETKHNEESALFSDFVTYTNAFQRIVWRDLYSFIQEKWYIIVFTLTCVELVQLSVMGFQSFIGNVRPPRLRRSERQNNVHRVHARHRL